MKIPRLTGWLFALLVTLPNVTCEESPQLIFKPPSTTRFYSPQTVQIDIQLSSQIKEQIVNGTTYGSRYYLALDYDHNDNRVNNIIQLKTTGDTLPIKYETFLVTSQLSVEHIIDQQTNETNPNHIIMAVNNLGYVSFKVAIIELQSSNFTKELITTIYKLTAYREKRLVDTGFNVAVTILVVLNTFAIGCLTDLKVLKQQLSEKLRIGVIIVTQYIAVPTLTLGLTRALKVDNEIALGLLYLACIPGGGLGHLIVAITKDADVDLSIFINAMEILLPLGAVPLYVYTFGNLLPNHGGIVVPSIYYLAVCSIVIIVPYVVGMLVRRRQEIVAEACLNWLIKPVLLLAFILFITLGLYINMYMFNVLNNSALVVGAVMPFLGFIVGGSAALISKAGKPAAKSIAIEAAIMNCIMAIVAVRFTLPQPDADLATAGIMWVLFFTPVPFLIMFIFHKTKKKVMFYFEKRKLEKQQRATMLQSFAAITRNALQMGGFATDNSANTPNTSENIRLKKIADNSKSESCDKSLLLRSTSQYSSPSHLAMSNTNATLLTPGEESHDNLLMDPESQQI